MNDQMTLYSAETNAFASDLDPANAFVKFDGLGAPAWTLPARAANPAQMMKSRTPILKNPSAFCSLSPHRGAIPWRRRAKVTTPTPIAL